MQLSTNVQNGMSQSAYNLTSDYIELYEVQTPVAGRHTVTLKTIPMIGYPEEIEQAHHEKMLQI